RSLEANLEGFHFREALKDAMSIARIGNKYISDTEPWKVAKTDMDRTASILYTSLQICANLAIAFEPFTPFSAEKLRGILKVGLDAGFDHRAGEGEPTVNFFKPGESRALHTVGAGVELRPYSAAASEAKREWTRPGSSACPTDMGTVLTWDDLGRGDILPVGHELGEAVLLFSKIEDSVIDTQIAKLNATKEANAAAAKAAAAEEASHKVEPQKAEVTFDDFGTMDIRVAKVLEAERVPKTDKLLRLTIDTGIDQRTIVSGIAEYYSPEDMIGKQICILANLKPRMIRSIESKGMILMAKQPDGKMRLISPAEGISNGAVVG
ncbi:MAG: methionine--tRNA ligase subunit beta, partial [Bacteroidales bacterium]|nr:methionine--tRNA ligase subunit beta [Bacteroidales bacterium]